MSEPVKYITDAQGERTAVVLPISDYEKLLEDLKDLAVVAERRGEPTIPHEQFVSELKLSQPLNKQLSTFRAIQ
jgi:hypothetical protein